MKTYENDSNEDLHLHWLIHLIHLDSSGEQKRCREELSKATCNPILFTLFSAGLLIFVELLNHVLIDFSNSTPGETGAGEEASPYSKVRMSDMHTLEHFRTGNLGATSHHFSVTDHAIPWDSSLFIRPRQAVIQSFSGRCRGESLGEGGTLLVAEAARRNEETTCITLVKKITQYHPIYPYLNSIIVLQSFAKCYKQKSSANCRHPSVVSIFQMHYLPLVVSTLLVLRIKLWKLTEYRRIVYLEPHQQLNFCSFATKCTGAHDLHFVLTISPVIWFDACAWAWPACPEDADILVHRPIDELFALPETHLKILYSDDLHVNHCISMWIVYDCIEIFRYEHWMVKYIMKTAF